LNDTKTFERIGREHRINTLLDQHPKLDEILVVSEKLVDVERLLENGRTNFQVFSFKFEVCINID